MKTKYLPSGVMQILGSGDVVIAELHITCNATKDHIKRFEDILNDSPRVDKGEFRKAIKPAVLHMIEHGMRRLAIDISNGPANVNTEITLAPISATE